MKVKICGIVRPEDLAAADAAGADYLGIVLVPGSKRYVSEAALRRLAAVPVRARRVGVFVGAAPRAIRRAVRIGRLDAVQLYRCTFRQSDVEVWHATPGGPGTVVWDAAPGEGRVGDWPRAARAARRRRLVLAGGLTPGNVADAVRAVRPWAVDGASGTEAAPGVKDPQKMTEFVRKAKSL